MEALARSIDTTNILVMEKVATWTLHFKLATDERHLIRMRLNKLEAAGSGDKPVEEPRQLVPEELLQKLRPQTVKRIAQDIDNSAMSDHYKAPFRDLGQMSLGDIHNAVRALTIEAKDG